MRARGLAPTREWREAQGKAWNIGDTIVHGIGQGFYSFTPLAICTMTARLATGRAVQPHLTRSIGGAAGARHPAGGWPSMGLSDRDLRLQRDAMWAAVNEPGGTAAMGKLPGNLGMMAGKTGTTQVRRVTREQRERGFNVQNLPWLRPHAVRAMPRMSIRSMPWWSWWSDGTPGGTAAVPLARDVMVETFARFRAIS